MRQPDGHHLAELNLGILKYDWDDPRVQDFVNGLALVNNVAMRSPGFVWMLPEEEMDRLQNDPEGPMPSHPRLASTLSVWEDLASLKHFVWKTVHKRFYDRRGEWYDMGAVLRMALWWVPAGHLPTMAEAMERFRHLEAEGPSDYAFDWDRTKEA
ncbi:MAG: DUF3291 domain-containing protein [Sulfitobacter sp.]|nr:DUF3291 domain-containing protein [Sulfitobacter sp.]